MKLKIVLDLLHILWINDRMLSKKSTQSNSAFPHFDVLVEKVILYSKFLPRKCWKDYEICDGYIFLFSFLYIHNVMSIKFLENRECVFNYSLNYWNSFFFFFNAKITQKMLKKQILKIKANQFKIMSDDAIVNYDKH